MKRAMAMVAAMVAATCGGSESGSLYVVAIRDTAPVAVKLVRAADCVAVAVTIVSEQKDVEQRFQDIRAVKRLIAAKAGAHKQVIVKDGPLALSARPTSKFSFVASHSSYDAPAAAAHLQVLLPLDGTAPDVFEAAAQISQFVKSVELPEKVRCDLGPVQLAVADPEQYRSQLQEAIAADVKGMAERMGVMAHVQVEGLQSPVVVRQRSESEVELFLNYSVTLDWASP